MTSRRVVVDAVKRAAFAATLKDDPRAKAWTGAAWPISQAEGDFEKWIEGGLQQIPGVDEDLAALAEATFAGEPSPLLTELEAGIPEGLFLIGTIKGLGAKKVKALWEQLGITSVGELQYALEENRLQSLKGFGPKTQEKIAAELERLRERDGQMRRDEAAPILENALADCAAAGVEVSVCGDYPMGAELVREVVLVVAAVAGQEDGQASSKGEDAGGGVASFLAQLGARRGVRVVQCAPEELGAVALAETASEAHLAALRALGPLEGATIDAVYAGLGLLPTPVERRIEGVPLVKIGSPAPELISLGALQGALHNHTTASDGRHSLTEMRDAAAAMGLRYLGISEHSQEAAYARGLSPDALRSQVATIAKMNGEGHDCRLLTGVESDILADGSLDYEEALLQSLDVVVASVHRRHRQSGEEMTARMCAAARHPQTCVVGHPTGRLLLSRKESGVRVADLLAACAESGAAVELNANPHRLDLSAVNLAQAKERGVLVSIGADAHSMEGLRNLHHGVALGRRAGLGPEDVLNARSVEELLAWRATRR